MRAQGSQPDEHDPGDPHDETCRCGTPRIREHCAWFCTDCDGLPVDHPEPPPPAGASS